MTFKMSEEAQTVKVSNLRPDTAEFIGDRDAYIPPYTGLPAHCTDIAPPDIPAAHVAIFDREKSTWSLAEDHRGKTVFDTTSGAAVYISELGPVPENTTSLVPDDHYQKWNGHTWIKDEAAEKAAQLLAAQNQKFSRMKAASIRIDTLQDAMEFNMATNEEKQNLADSKKYRVLLSRIDTDTALVIQWPVTPE